MKGVQESLSPSFGRLHLCRTRRVIETGISQGPSTVRNIFRPIEVFVESIHSKIFSADVCFFSLVVSAASASPSPAASGSHEP